MAHSRYDRQQRIQGWSQEALAQARVLMVGAGALGNETLKNLVLLGVGHILVIDFDRIEPSNLSRTVLFRESDIGQPKARVAAEAATHLNPEVDIRSIDGDVFYDVGLGFYRHSDLVIGALDSVAARSQVGVSCALAGVPFLDGGMWALGGEVRCFFPGDGPCFECTLNDEDRKRAYERRSCTGFRIQEDDRFPQQVPTTVTTAAVIGGMLAQETVRYLCKWDIRSGEAAVYNGVTLTMHHAALPRNPECPYHLPYQGIVELDYSTNKVTAGELLELAEAALGKPAVLELGRDLLVQLFCHSCHQQENVGTVLGRVDEAILTCPHCGKTREAKIIARLAGHDPYGDRPLSALGVPPGEVLAVRSGEHLQLYEFTADVNTFWA